MANKRRRPVDPFGAPVASASTLLETRTIAVQQHFLLAAYAASIVFFAQVGFDAFEMPKFLAIGLLVLSAAVVSVGRAVASGMVALPRREVLVAVGLFVLGLIVATVTSPSPHISVPGDYKRLTGFVPYLVYATTFLLVVRTFDLRSARRLALVAVVAGGLSALLGVLQWAGLDPFTWGGAFSDAVFATFGNPNFASGGLGMVLPFAVWGVLEAEDWRWRAASGVTALLVIVVIVATTASQGVFAAGAGVAVFGLVWLRGFRGGRWRSQVTAAWAGLAALVVALAVTGLAGSGPLASLGTQDSFRLRKLYWTTALRMFRDHPVTGVGLDLYGTYVPTYRPQELYDLLGPAVTVDQPHSVPLALLSGGGLLLLLGYLAFVGVVATAAVLGIRRLEGREILLFGAVAGGWTAYQVQSLVSIDVPSIAFPNWILGGVVVVMGLGRQPVPVALPLGWGRRRNTSATAQRRSLGRIWSGTAIAGLVLLVLASFPWRADDSYSVAQGALARNEPAIAAQYAERAAEQASWWPEYWYGWATALAAQERYPEAAAALRELLDRNELSAPGWHFLARMLQRTGDPAGAIAAYERLLELDPLPLDHKAEFAQYLAEQGQVDRSLALIEPTLEAAPDDARYWLLLGRIYMEAGRTDDALAALERVPATAVPGQEDLVDEARRRLEELGVAPES